MGDEEGGLSSGLEESERSPMGDQEAQSEGSPWQSGDTWAEGRQGCQCSQEPRDQPWFSFAA